MRCLRVSKSRSSSSSAARITAAAVRQVWPGPLPPPTLCKQVFKFRHFDLCQDGAAMKMGTDAMILGAWAQPARLPVLHHQHSTADMDSPHKDAVALQGTAVGANTATQLRMLDIGTGSGVLALMLAQKASQRQPAVAFLVDALDVDAGAATQAAANAAASPWAEHIHVHHCSLQDWWDHVSAGNTNAAGSAQAGYHTIVCNPPFFLNSSKPPDAARAVARHADVLPYEQLAAAAAALLHPVHGSFFVILPLREAAYFGGIAAEVGLHVCHILRMYTTAEDKEPVRLLLQLVRGVQQPGRGLLEGAAVHRLEGAAVQHLEGAAVQGPLPLAGVDRPSAAMHAAVQDLVVRQRLPGSPGHLVYTEQYRQLTQDFHLPSAFVDR